MSLSRGRHGGAGGQVPGCPHPRPRADPATLLRPLGPQRVFDLQQGWDNVNVTSGCAPAPRTQPQGQGPRGLRAAQKVGHLEAGVGRAVGGGRKAAPHLPASFRPPGRPTQPPAPPGPCVLLTLAPQRHPRRLPVWGPPVWSPGVHPRAGHPQERVRRGQVGRRGVAALADGLARLPGSTCRCWCAPTSREDSCSSRPPSQMAAPPWSSS